MSGLSSGIEALDFTDGQFAFEFNRYASGIGRNPGVHVFAGSCSAIAGEYEGDVVTLVLLFVVLDGLNAGILDCEQFFALAAENVDGKDVPFLPCVIGKLAHIIKGCEHVHGCAHGS